VVSPDPVTAQVIKTSVFISKFCDQELLSGVLLRYRG